MFDFPPGASLLSDKTAKLGATLWSFVTATIFLGYDARELKGR